MSNPYVPEPHSPAVRPSRFSHIVLQTKRFPEMLDWYKTVLMAKPVYETEILSFLTYDEEHHRLLIGHNPHAADRVPNAVGVAHWAYTFQSFQQLVDAYVRLRDQGIVPRNCINHGFTTSIYYRDPDDNEVELACDNFETTEEINAWFANGQFDRNFVGVPFDPEDMVTLHAKGVPLGQFMSESYE